MLGKCMMYLEEVRSEEGVEVLKCCNEEEVDV
jgi:hypothetical protein